MNIPTIRIVSDTFRILAQVPRYTSLQFNRLWQAVGTFELHISDYAVVLPYLQEGHYILLDDDSARAGIIDNVVLMESDIREVVVTGYTCNWWTRQRINKRPDDDTLAAANYGYDPVPYASAGGEVTSLPAETVIKTYANRHLIAPTDSNRRLPGLRCATDQGRGMALCWLAETGAQLEDTLTQICEYADMGYEVRLDVHSGALVLDVIPGTNRTRGQDICKPVVFSLQMVNTISASYERGGGDYKNVAYAMGEELTTGLRSLLAVTQEENMPAGARRRETAADCGTLSIAETDTSLSMQTMALQQLKETRRTECLSCQAVPLGTYQYLRDFDLGDLVTTDLVSFGVSIDQRITAVSEVYEPGIISITPTFGTPKNARVRLLKRLRHLKLEG